MLQECDTRQRERDGEREQVGWQSTMHDKAHGCCLLLQYLFTHAAKTLITAPLKKPLKPCTHSVTWSGHTMAVRPSVIAAFSCRDLLTLMLPISGVAAASQMRTTCGATDAGGACVCTGCGCVKCRLGCEVAYSCESEQKGPHTQCADQHSPHATPTAGRQSV